MLRIYFLFLFCLIAISGCTDSEPGYFVINVKCKREQINQDYNGGRVFLSSWILILRDKNNIKKQIQDDCTLTYYELRNIRESNKQRPKTYIKYNKNYGLVYSHQIKTFKSEMIKKEKEKNNSGDGFIFGLP